VKGCYEKKKMHAGQVLAKNNKMLGSGNGQIRNRLHYIMIVIK
jgi:hypothetical protein